MRIRKYKRGKDNYFDEVIAVEQSLFIQLSEVFFVISEIATDAALKLNSMRKLTENFPIE